MRALLPVALLVLWLFSSIWVNIVALISVAVIVAVLKLPKEGRGWIAEVALANGFAGILSAPLIGFSTRQPNYDFAVWQYGMAIVLLGLPSLAIGVFSRANDR